MALKRITLSHGSGGSLTHGLIKKVIFKKLNNPILKELGDSALLGYKKSLAFTTDSFVVNPVVFPGGDIGKLAVCGTINDLVVYGAVPQYLSLGIIIEEGLEYRLFEKIIDSVSYYAEKNRVFIVTGDLKVVERGAADKIFINTSGIGALVKERRLSIKNIAPGDRIIITGDIGEHGFSVLLSRKGFYPGLNIRSDCASLRELIIPVLKNSKGIKFMRDPTRGGLAATLNEIAETTGSGLIIDEKKIPISEKVKVASELLGIDPLYSANEGKAVMIVKKEESGRVIRLLKKNALGRKASEIGVVAEKPKSKVILNTAIGTQRIIDMPVGEQLPRIC